MKLIFGKIHVHFTWMERCEIERSAVREKGARMATLCIYICVQLLALAD
jgi:hypothetical protein